MRDLADVETHLILTPAGARTIIAETDRSPNEVRCLAHHVHHPRDIGASVSSGSFLAEGMLVAPCSIKTLSGIAHCYNGELLVRAAASCFFCAKPRPMPAFYHRPSGLDEIIDQTVARALDLFGVGLPTTRRWVGTDTE